MGTHRRAVWTIIAALVLAAPAGSAADELELPKLDLPKVKIKETVVNVNPSMQFYLPNGAVDLSLGKPYRRSTVNFSSRYDFVDNFLGFEVGYEYRLSQPLRLGIDLYDKVDFSEFYARSEYLQRRQSVGPSLAYALGPRTRIVGGLNFEKTYTNAVKTLQVIDEGRNTWGSAGLVWDTLPAADDPAATPRGGKASLVLTRSFSSLGSDYEYAKAECALQRFLSLGERAYAGCRVRAGYPLDLTRTPLTEDYTAGGYSMLRGYDFKEFRGDALLFGSLSCNVPLTDVRRSYFGVLASSLITGSVFFDAAKIGGRSIYTTPGGFKASCGAELSCNLTVFKNIPLRLGFTAAKACENRPVYFYVSLASTYYTWRNE
jgi:outer membrane protein assembly factor BamA